ncbi:MAG: export transporter ATP-binding protein [Pseudomonadota bacterium]|jgi:lipopolysaccharide export system ATP-binding protein|uniref:Lipopolysaccharide export system ATP-binding protein LptB n=1 Tax=Thiothrix fructosivorans TaxID=111770 RepID=A0A8B0SE34_9GAMM|nr:LPS export ABC transporter ATP-binding protein [Thiothrix fructosivorans]MBO0614790.1 LPS export ABC transporter ATP-binding protein [Thiothrix fructosivorans]QTX09606.1 LPS export ABC transporter ATP-binding protein [Thiothrix fructosivorans]
MNTLAARNLQKSYKKRQILKGVDLHVNNAEVVGLLGPNGAGKTTCFYMIVGLVGADAGQVLLNDKDITAQAMHERAREGIGYLAQEASIFRSLTVAQNIMAVLELRKDLNRQQRQAKVDSLLDEFQLTHLRDSHGISLSGGERRRAEIARALASDPAFILLDEPFAGVDPISVLEIQKIIRHLVERDIGVLITDHNVRETLGICHRAYILSEGKILVEGTPEAILQDEQARRVYLGENFKL